MKVMYKFYEPNQGLEEIQTDIYNQNIGFNALGRSNERKNSKTKSRS